MRTTLLLFISFIAVQSFGQQQDSTTISSENVEVVKNYEAIIATAVKKDIPINYEPNRPAKKNYTYRTDKNVDLDIETIEPSIRPKIYDEEKSDMSDIKDGTVYGAYGNMNTINAGGAFHYYIEDWMEAGFAVDHLSTRSPNNVYNRANTTGSLYASYYLSPKNKIGIEGFGDNIGREINMDIAESYSKIKYQKTGGAINLSHNSFETSGFAFRGRLSYDRLNNSNTEMTDDADEKLLSAQSNIIKKISDDLNFEVDFNWNNYSQINLDKRSDLILRPRLQLRKGKIVAKGGIEYIKTETESFLFPIVDVQWNQLYKNFGLRLYTSSDFHRTSMHHIYTQNPYYMIGSVDVLPSYRRSYNLEINYVYKKLTPKLRVSYNDYLNDIFYLNTSMENYSTESMFMIKTADRKEISLSPMIEFRTSDVEIASSFRYNFFIDQSTEDVIYRPRMSADLNFSAYVWNDKLKITQLTSFVGERFAQDENGVSQELKPFVDLGLRLEYDMSKTFSIYAEGVNLINQDYQFYYNIENIGRQFWGGVRVRL